MTMQQTSLLAYEEASTRIGKHQQEVLAVIRDYQPVCNQQIAEVLDWPINTVTPRVKELREMHKVVEAKKDLYRPTNRTVIYWGIAR